MDQLPLPLEAAWHELCSCMHPRAVHDAAPALVTEKACRGLDSYGCPCRCPAFELSQEEREEAR